MRIFTNWFVIALMTMNYQNAMKAANKSRIYGISMPKCFCGKPKLLTIPPENEIICKNCGVTFGFDEYYDTENTIPFYHVTKSSLNISQSRQTGSNPYDVKRMTYIKNLRVEKNNSTDVASIADVCNKLKLPNTIAEECWKLYQSIRKNNSRFTRSKSICMAIYQTCQNHKIPYDEKSVQDIVCQSLGVKNAPKLKSVIFKIHNNHSILKYDSKREFYLNQHLSQAQNRHKLQDITTLQHLATQYYENFTSICRLNNNNNSMLMNNQADHNTLAKRAVSLAILRCCVN